MNELERKYFEALFYDRSESADMLEKPSMRGIKNSVSGKYRDQAHFIYELLQNADDAGATMAHFVLKRDRLIFVHNGTHHFSVSNPNNENEDSVMGNLGDINAITSIANSNKTEASIGKFGVGFKAVFQYTSTPRIYDPNFRFQINRFIVPAMLDADHPDRHEDETLFEFPFNHEERSAEKAYADIAGKLRSLSFPTLFLTNLKDISFKIGKETGFYGKKVVRTMNFEGTIAEKICFAQSCKGAAHIETLWLFSRNDDCGYRYSVGFFLNSEGHLKPVTEPAFCFFPTKEVTGLNFMIHAPFLLTDSREGILAGDAHNDHMLWLLAELAADAIVYMREIGNKEKIRLIDDSILSIVPIDEAAFSDPEDKEQVSFKSFYTAIKARFEHEAILPTENGYASANDAYWAAAPQLTKLFSDEQLSLICGHHDAKWVFASLGREQLMGNRTVVVQYIDSIVRTNVNEDAIISGRSNRPVFNTNTRQMQPVEGIRGIDSAFIERQPISWLHRFYEWLSETRHRTEIIKRRPVFLDQNRKATAAFDEEDQLILFYPCAATAAAGYRTVCPELLENLGTMEFIKQVGITEPSLRDQIYNIILPRYQNDGEIDTYTDFNIFLKYYCSCPSEDIDDFFERIRDCDFVAGYRPDNEEMHRFKANKLYMPTDELIRFFTGKPNTYFVAVSDYEDLADDKDKKMIRPFLRELGVKPNPERKTQQIGDDSGCHIEKEYVIDGLAEIVHSVVAKQDVDLSVFLWGELCGFIRSNLLNQAVLEKEISSRKDRRWKWVTSYAESSTAKLLREQPWLTNRDGAFAAPCQLSIKQLSDCYDLQDPNARDLLKLLNIQERSPSENDLSNLTDIQREQIEFAEQCKKLGITLEDLIQFSKQKQAQKELEQSRQIKKDQTMPNIAPQIRSDRKVEMESTVDIDGEQPAPKVMRVIKNLIHRTRVSAPRQIQCRTGEVDEPDQDELMPVEIDYSKEIERAMQKNAADIDRIAQLEELQNAALAAPRYSFLWFKTLLEMEILSSNESASNSREISISFARVELEAGTQRTLILKHPNRYIPQFMEDLADIPLELHMGSQTKKVAVEVANIKSYTLRVKLKTNAEIEDIDLSTVNEATIIAKNPGFLLEKLYDQFVALEHEDGFDMQGNLCDNIKFVFGPPGTGKTTYLAREVLIPLMQEKKSYKILVLAPTNKAADVLTSRIMDVSGTDDSYNDWLVRFGTTNDEAIEDSAVYRDKTFDLRTLPRNVTVTTIARFPYDFFMPEGTRLYLNGMNWDYIVVDEASMIPLVNIIYVLYKKTPQKFIVAGDPFQIEPITSVALWKNENIYTMVNLNSFSDKAVETIPHRYEIERLITQYRSIPTVGEIFSKLTYSGVLKHYRQNPANDRSILKNTLM